MVEKGLEHDFIRSEGNASIGDDLSDEALIRVRTSLGVTEDNCVILEPVKGWSNWNGLLEEPARSAEVVVLNDAAFSSRNLEND